MSGGVARVAFADALASGMEVMTAVVELIVLLVRRMGLETAILERYAERGGRVACIRRKTARALYCWMW